jgi:hypothetical protein
MSMPRAARGFEFKHATFPRPLSNSVGREGEIGGGVELRPLEHFLSSGVRFWLYMQRTEGRVPRVPNFFQIRASWNSAL